MFLKYKVVWVDGVRYIKYRNTADGTYCLVLARTETRRRKRK